MQLRSWVRRSRIQASPDGGLGEPGLKQQSGAGHADHVSRQPGLRQPVGGSKGTVVGCRGHGAFDRLLLGSATMGLLHYRHGPIAIVHAEGTPAADAPVLVGIEGSPASDGITALAFEEASRRGVDLVALHAGSDVGIFTEDWPEHENQGRELLTERAGSNSMPTCRCIDGSCVTTRPVGCARSLNTVRWWPWVVTAAADSRACCWARSARR